MLYCTKCPWVMAGMVTTMSGAVVAIAIKEEQNQFTIFHSFAFPIPLPPPSTELSCDYRVLEPSAVTPMDSCFRLISLVSHVYFETRFWFGLRWVLTRNSIVAVCVQSSSDSHWIHAAIKEWKKIFIKNFRWSMALVEQITFNLANCSLEKAVRGRFSSASDFSFVCFGRRYLGPVNKRKRQLL